MATTKRCLGLDIGGANLKAATTDGFAREVAFPLWRNPEGLSSAIASLIAAAPPHARLVATMTGELADCYATKAEGVRRLVAAAALAAPRTPLRIFSQRRALLAPEQAADLWAEVAAANWAAVAMACGELATPPLETWDGVVVDVGSTTVDITPSHPSFADDLDRLQAGRLLYFGVGRTPLCAVVDTLPYRGAMCPVAAENFATTADVSLLLDYAAASQDSDTADGRPFTKPHSVARIGRMLCLDATRFDEGDAVAAAQHVCGILEQRIAAAIADLPATRPPRRFLICGSGAWLARAALLRAGRLDGVIALSDIIGVEAARCATAWAVALLGERWNDA